MRLIRLLFALSMLSSVSAWATTERSHVVVFSQAELDQMLAPVALYPDSVLSHVLIAATYPLEVIQAARWSRANPGLSGESALDAVAEMDWDPSVMALTAFPELLARMDEDIEWTHRLGDAFLAQEGEVLDTIQQLRQRAWDHGSLQTNEHVQVIREKEYIYIEPVQTRVVYVPVYNPHVVYGSWWWSAHPPVFWYPPRRHVFVSNFYWSWGYSVAPGFYFSAFHWPRRQLVVHHHYHHHHHHHHRQHRRHDWHGRHRHDSSRSVARHNDARHWRHDPVHRRGVSYRNDVPDARMARRARSAEDIATPRAGAGSRSAQREWAADRRERIGREGMQARPGAGGERGDWRERRLAGAEATGRSDGRDGQRRGERPDIGSARSERGGAEQGQPRRNHRLVDGTPGERSPRVGPGEGATRADRPRGSAEPGQARSRPGAPSAEARAQAHAQASRDRAQDPSGRSLEPGARPAIDRAEPGAGPAAARAPSARAQVERNTRPAAAARQAPAGSSQQEPRRTMPQAPARAQQEPRNTRPQAPARAQQEPRRAMAQAPARTQPSAPRAQAQAPARPAAAPSAPPQRQATPPGNRSPAAAGRDVGARTGGREGQRRRD